MKTKIKKYEIDLILENQASVVWGSRRDIMEIFDAIDDLWTRMDIAEWQLKIQPYWEEVDLTDG